VRHSRADIARAREQLGYEPTYDVKSGLGETVTWHRRAAR
jgi:nucleoside-diphosphate-sugar epimerase